MNTQHKKQSYKALLEAVACAGGQKALARICGDKITQVHVRNWLYRNKKKCLPAEYAIKVEKALNGKITRQQLRPDIYPHE